LLFGVKVDWLAGWIAGGVGEGMKVSIGEGVFRRVPWGAAWKTGEEC